MSTTTLRNGYLISILVMLVVGGFPGCQDPKPVRILCGSGMDYQCPSYMYCDLGKNCGNIDERGVCVMRPNQCPTSDEPVCGCNSKTYRNACVAAVNGVTPAHKGPCENKVAAE